MTEFSFKRVKETNLNENKNRTEIFFESSADGKQKEKTVTLSGEGNIKVLLPV